MSLADQLRAQGLKSPEEYQAEVTRIKERIKQSSRVEQVNQSLNESVAELSTAMTMLP